MCVCSLQQCLLRWLFNCMAIYLSVGLSVSLLICLCLLLSLNLPLPLSAYFYVYLSIFICFYVSVCLFACLSLSAFLYVYLCLCLSPSSFSVLSFSLPAPPNQTPPLQFPSKCPPPPFFFSAAFLSLRVCFSSNSSLVRLILSVFFLAGLHWIWNTYIAKKMKKRKSTHPMLIN